MEISHDNQDAEPTESRPPDYPDAVVGFGVSAISLTALGQVLDDLDPSLNIAILIAAKQHDGVGATALLGELARSDSWRVALAVDGEPLAAGRVYVGGSDALISVENGHVKVREVEEPVGHRATVDSVLMSLAEQENERAVAVLLAGLDPAGSAALTATKTFGGLSIAQIEDGEDPLAQGAAHPSAVADLRLPVDRIGAEIGRYVVSLGSARDASGQDEVPQDIEAQVTQVATILRNVTSHDFHAYKRGTFIRRIHRRMQVLQIADIDSYVACLKNDREEVQSLFQDLLIGVTQFFRDPAEFEALEREIPRLFENKGPEDQFRVWVLGCATGEEAYSIAMLLREHMATLDRPPEVQIFATDLDARALNLARAGRYSDAIADHVRPDRLERWFVREGDTYCVSKELRELCIFSPHNIVKDAPFSRVDILSCRNLLIYLNTELQNRVIPIFHFSLRANGILFLGSSENVTRHQRLFAPVDRRNRVFRRLDTATRVIPDFPLTSRIRSPDGPEGQPAVLSPSGRLSTAINRQADAIAERYAPAYFVVDGHGDVLHFSGRTGRYLEPTAGAATLNLSNLLHRDLRLDLRSALTRATTEARRIEIPRLILRQDDKSHGVNVIIEPLGGGDVTLLVVVFQDLGPVGEAVAGLGDRVGSDEHIQRLEAELRVTRDRLQATIEELESTNEELKSSNEEYQSINEELQSANEEMETSKEELQSVNEELQTVNGELSHRVQELGRTNSDLKNLLESTQIATVFLDNELHVRNFTPAATEVFHLLESDVGRPLDHVVSRVLYPELQDDVRRVLKTLVPLERAVVDPSIDRHYVARVLPYRSVDNYISGSVVTFTDMTAVYKAEAALRDSQRQLADELADLTTLQTVSSELVQQQDIVALHVKLLEAAMGLMRSDAASLQMLDPEDGSLRLLASRGFHPESEAFWSRVEAGSGSLCDLALARGERAILTDVEQNDSLSAENMAEFHRSGIRAVQSSPLVSRSGQLLGMISTHWRQPHDPLDREFVLFDVLARQAADLIERSQAETALLDLTREMETLLAGMPQLVWRAEGVGQWTWASPQWTEFTGQTSESSRALGWLEMVDAEDRQAALDAWARAEADGGFDVEYRIRSDADRRYRWFRTRARPVRDEFGKIVEWLGTSTDIDDMRALQSRQELLVGELQHRVRNILTVVRSVFARTVESGSDQADVSQHFLGRLDSLARTQVIVTRSAEGLVELEDLVRDELLSAGVGDGPTLEIDGPRVMLDSKSAESIGLAIHELTTNAMKYGALKVAKGKIFIRWTANLGEGGERRLNLVWEEQGVPAVPVKPTREGFGRELIEEALPYQLEAETRLEFRRGGVRCSMSIPLPRDRSAAE